MKTKNAEHFEKTPSLSLPIFIKNEPEKVLVIQYFPKIELIKRLLLNESNKMYGILDL